MERQEKTPQKNDGATEDTIIDLTNTSEDDDEESDEISKDKIPRLCKFCITECLSKLEDLVMQTGTTMKFDEFPPCKEGNYRCILTIISTVPTAVCYGLGKSPREARAVAAINILDMYNLVNF